MTRRSRRFEKAAGGIRRIGFRNDPPDTGSRTHDDQMSGPPTTDLQNSKVGGATLLETQTHSKIVTEKQMSLTMILNSPGFAAKTEKNGAGFFDVDGFRVVEGFGLQ